MADVTVSYDQLHALCAGKLMEAGVDLEQAKIVADVLVHADLRGVYSHGTIRTEHYINRLRAGTINLHPKLSVNPTGPVTAVVDGDDGFGHVISKYAMEQAIRLAQDQGVGMVGVINSTHCGALSYYVRQAADADLIGMAMTHADQGVVPFGGVNPFFGTNPIAYGFPAKRNDPIILDMATSSVAFGKVMVAKERGESIPPSWGVDANGKPTTDPHAVKALLPFAGPKGYGLGMVVDIFSGLLVGAAFGPHIVSMYRDLQTKRKLGHFFCVIHPAKFTDHSSFLTGMDQMIDELHSAQPAEGFDQVLVPGEPENLHERERLIDGIPIPESVFRFLTL